MEGELPEVVVYQTGGGTGLIGMWKGFAEMEEIGWINSRRPRMISVQSTGCAPIVKAFEEGKDRAEPWPEPHTIASGLRVPSAIGDFLMLRALRESGGRAVAVEEERLVWAVREVGRLEGIFCAPEGAATILALERLIEDRDVSPSDRIVLFNTGTGLKYLDALGPGK
jgi:threonine synthase